MMVKQRLVISFYHLPMTEFEERENHRDESEAILNGMYSETAT